MIVAIDFMLSSSKVFYMLRTISSIIQPSPVHWFFHFHIEVCLFSDVIFPSFLRSPHFRLPSIMPSEIVLMRRMLRIMCYSKNVHV